MERELAAMVRFMTMGTNEMLKNDLMSTGLTTILAERILMSSKAILKKNSKRQDVLLPMRILKAPF